MVQKNLITFGTLLFRSTGAWASLRSHGTSAAGSPGVARGRCRDAPSRDPARVAPAERGDPPFDQNSSKTGKFMGKKRTTKYMVLPKKEEITERPHGDLKKKKKELNSKRFLQLPIDELLSHSTPPRGAC